MSAAALYAVSMSSPTALGAVPEDAQAKTHHSKDGKGFINPWESSKDFGVVEIMRKIIW
jgi:N-acyl-phosphatidylethanolamine-hydrolysing phospholipase D